MHVCKVCHRSFARKSNLRRHMNALHNNTVDAAAKQNGYGFTRTKTPSRIINVTAHNAIGTDNKYQDRDLYDAEIFKWKHPFTCIIAGPTGCGKSTFVTRFLKNLVNLVDKPISEVLYCAPETSYPDLSECSTPVRYLDWLPNAEILGTKKDRLVIIDDMMRESDESVVDLFTKHSHHLSVSVMFLCQNIFHKGKGQRDISLNSHYIVALKSPRDRTQISSLARQICPGKTAYINEIFEDATKKPYGYLLLDVTQTTPDHLRYRTNIFPGDEPPKIIYVPKTYHPSLG